MAATHHSKTILAVAACCLIAAPAAHAERDWSIAAFADPGAPLAVQQPIMISELLTPAGTVAVTVTGTIAVAGRTVATVAPQRFDVGPGTTRATLAISQEAIDAARTAAAQSGSAYGRLSLTATAPGSTTEATTWPTTVAIGTSPSFKGRWPVRPGRSSNLKGVRTRTISFAPCSRWSLVPDPYVRYFSSRIAGACTIAFSWRAYMLRSRDPGRALKAALVSARLVRRLSGPVPVVLGTYCPLGPESQLRYGLRAISAVRTAPRTYAFLVLNGTLGAGCTDEQRGVALAALGKVVQSARLAR